MRIVLDTNVFIAGLITRETPPDRIYRLWLRGHIDVIASPPQIEELSRVLARPRLHSYLDPEEAELILTNIGARALIVHDLPDVDLSPDPDDNAILATALAGEAHMIVSGDKKHMLDITPPAGIPIVAPTDALTRLCDQ